ncbi:MAG: peptidoglycan editing factor PgeF [Paracoccaceae bacterium]
MLKPLTDPALAGATHGFFTRNGGVSGGIYKGLNCGRSANDHPADIEKNRALVAAEMSISPAALINVQQVHSCDVLTLDGPLLHPPPKADAMVTRQPGLGLGILTADCAPVLFYDPQAQVIGAAHAGWKGALGGISDNTIAAMLALGAARENISAVIGPCISQRTYEVGPEFCEAFLDANPEHSQFFANAQAGKMLFDLPMFILNSLRNAGIKSASWTGHCTYSNPETFYSYRRATHAGEADYGRQISVIRL